MDHGKLKIEDYFSSFINTPMKILNIKRAEINQNECFFKLKIYGREQSRGISESSPMGHTALLIPTINQTCLTSCMSAGALAVVIFWSFSTIRR